MCGGSCLCTGSFRRRRQDRRVKAESTLPEQDGEGMRGSMFRPKDLFGTSCMFYGRSLRQKENLGGLVKTKLGKGE